jgi:uncharacterized protein YndB with AHSA1/START domain
MPIKKDGRGKRWVEMELLVPGTPEQVWQAMATGEGNAGWFIQAEIEPRVGGALEFKFGQGAVSTGEVTHWEPPHQFGYIERDWDKGAPPVTTEITIAAHSGGKCVMRMVHSLFTSSDAWDDQVEGFEQGWPGFFAVLRLYLAHFAGAEAACFMAQTESKLEPLPAWLRLGEVLGLTGASVGERRTSAAAPEAWPAVVEHVYQDARQRYTLVRLDGPAPGIALVGVYDKGETRNVGVSRYHYGEGAGALAAENEARWRAWLEETFGSTASEGRS